MKFLLSICILFYFNAFGFSQNLALNKIISGHTDLKNVKYVFDGNRLTSTETDYKISLLDQIWVSVDLEEMQYIKSIVFVPKQYFLQHTTHQIFLMNKKKEWEKFLEFTVYLNNNTPFTKEINKEAQGIKIVTIKTSSFFGWYEIEINGKNPTSPYTDTEDDKARAIFEYVKAECGNLTAYQRFYLIGTSSPFVKTVDSLFLNCYLPKNAGMVLRGYIGKDEQVLYKQTRPELKPFVESFIFNKLKSETPLGPYENKPYSGCYFEFISVFPDNPNNNLLKEIGDKYKKTEDAKWQEEINLKISEREAQERWERNNSSGSSSGSSSGYSIVSGNKYCKVEADVDGSSVYGIDVSPMLGGPFGQICKEGYSMTIESASGKTERKSDPWYSSSSRTYEESDLPLTIKIRYDIRQGCTGEWKDVEIRITSGGIYKIKLDVYP
jgi:hypothetical protein